MRMIKRLYARWRARHQYQGRHFRHSETWEHLRCPGQVVIDPWQQREATLIANPDRDHEWVEALRRMANRRSPALALQ